MRDEMAGQITFADLDSQFTKTSPEPSAVTKEGTSRQSLRKSSGSQTQMLPLFLCLKRDGPTADALWEKTSPGFLFPLHGVCTTPNSGAFHRDGNGCVWLETSMGSQHQKYYLVLNCGEKPKEPMPTRLSEVLERNVDSRYCLSPKACQGILNRAARRGKELPEALRLALEMRVAMDVPSPSRNEQENPGGEREY